MSGQSGKANSRDIVLSMLLQTLEEGAFSHLVVKEAFDSHCFSAAEKAFILRLFHGTLEQVLFLDWIIQSYSNTKLKKLKPVVRNILRMSIYQMLFMDAVPDHAAVSEAGKLAQKRGLSGLKPFINGVLRSFQRGGVKPGMPENIKHSTPDWLYDLLLKECGKAKTDAFLDAAAAPRDFLFARMQIQNETPETILASLKEEGCEVSRMPEIDEAIRIRHVGNLTDLTAFQKGWIFVQDLSSMQVAHQAARLAEKGQVKQILDLCAAPGGKSLHLADLFPDSDILSRDISEEKTARIEENICRCQVTNVRTEVKDARETDPALLEAVDLVVADLPCSGIGVIGRKPDIKHRLQPEDIASLSALQREILTVSEGYVKPGGLLLYSTCTISRAENEDNAAWFAERFPYRLVYEHQWIPKAQEGDGFYLACFQKEK